MPGKIPLLRLRFLLCAMVLGPWCWLFGRTLGGQRTFAFRDSAHYYFPLFQWAQNQWAEGRVPLWNPLENCGVPVLAETAASVFYPPKLLFATPIAYPQQYTLYVAGHVLLAVATAYLLARRFGASRLASTLGALSYGFGGNVLFQYCNVVFLVGAAWLPLALLAGQRLLRTRRWDWTLGLGTVLALMTLGGDPQSAYHALLLLGLYAFILAGRARWRIRRRRSQLSKDTVWSLRWPHGWPHGWPRRFRRSRPILLLGGAAWGLALAAVQILPAMDWTRQSERAVYDDPRNLYEAAVVATTPLLGVSEDLLEEPAGLPSDRWQRIVGGLLGSPSPGTHHDHVFQFSVGPWRLPELLWPNVSGRLLPTHRRWLNVLPAEGRVWNPSLYIGLLPILLATCVWRPWSRQRQVAWMSWTVLLAGLGALGWYGAGWLALEIRAHWLGHVPKTFPVGPQVGGVYWLMTTVLPGYVYFRFPAKLLVVANLGLSILAALGWDHAGEQAWRTVRRLLAVVGLLSFSILTLAMVAREQWTGWLRDVPPDEFFGPLDAAGAHADLVASLLHALLLAVVVGCVLRGSRWLSPTTQGVLLLLLTAVDLSIAHGQSLPTAPARLWAEPSAVATAIARHESAEAPKPAPSRVYRGSMFQWRPTSWGRGGSWQRPTEAVVWERDSLFPKYNLPANISLVESQGTIASADFLAVMRVARQYGPVRGDTVRQPHPEVLRALNAGYMVLPDSGRIPGTRPLPWSSESLQSQREPEGSSHRGAGPEDVRLWSNSARLPRAWIVHQVGWLPPLARPPLGPPHRRAIEQRTRQVYFPQQRPRRLDREAVIESPIAPAGTAELSSIVLPMESESPAGSCRIVLDLPDRVAVEAELSRPGLLVLSDLFTADWHAELTSEGQVPRMVPIWRANRIMRGVQLPAGRSRVVFRYRPWSFYGGAFLSLCACLGGLALSAWRLRHRAAASMMRRDCLPGTT